MTQVVCLELDAHHLVQVAAAQFLELLFSLLLAQHDVAVLVARHLVEEHFAGEPLPIFLLKAERCRNLEVRHDRVVLDVVIFVALIDNFYRIAQSLRHIGEKFVHLGRRLEPLLLGVAHSVRVVQILARIQADQVVMGIAVLLVHEVYVVGADELDAVLLRHLDEELVVRFLLLVALWIVERILRDVALEFQIVVVAEQVLMPQDSHLGSCNVARLELLGHLATDARRTADQVLVVFFKHVVVDTRTHVVAIDPADRHRLDKVLVAGLVLGQQDKVPTRAVLLALLLVQRATRHIDLASENRLDGRQSGLLALLVVALGDVEELLDSEHVAVVGDGESRHIVVRSLVPEPRNLALPVEQRIFSVNVKVCKRFHYLCCCSILLSCECFYVR